MFFDVRSLSGVLSIRRAPGPNIPLDPGELVRIAWEGLHQEGVAGGPVPESRQNPPGPIYPGASRPPLKGCTGWG